MWHAQRGAWIVRRQARLLIAHCAIIWWALQRSAREKESRHTTYFCVTHKCNFQFISRDFSIRKKAPSRALFLLKALIVKKVQKRRHESASERVFTLSCAWSVITFCFIPVYSLCVELGNFFSSQHFSAWDLTRKTITLFHNSRTAPENQRWKSI